MPSVMEEIALDKDDLGKAMQLFIDFQDSNDEDARVTPSSFILFIHKAQMACGVPCATLFTHTAFWVERCFLR